MSRGGARFGWFAIARVGLVQAMLGAVVVLTTSTLNRVMVVELALPALLPGLLVALHHAVQLSRPRMGHGSDVGGRRTPWIVGGIATLALGGVGAAVATAWMASDRGAGLVLAVVSFALVGLGVSAGGTSLLVMLAKRVDPPRRAAAATLVWVMMIAGFAITAGLAGRWLDPYSPARLVAVSATVSALAVVVTLLALWRLEGPAAAPADGRAAPSGPATAAAAGGFAAALGAVWSEPAARRFTAFVFVSMLAYSTQDLILEPFAGTVFGYTPGASTQLAGIQHGGTLAGMLLAALAGRRILGVSTGSLRAWAVAGCLGSGLALAGLVVGAAHPGDWPLRLNVAILGAFNGAFSIAAIGSMMALASGDRGGREGTRMGLWGAAQAVGFAAGGLFGAALADLARALLGDAAAGYGTVFAVEAALFAVSAALAARIATPAAPHGAPASRRPPPAPSRRPGDPADAADAGDPVNALRAAPLGATT